MKPLTGTCKPLRSQRGGAVVGVIVGLLIGLGVALGVAMYVAKVPVPFVDKVGTRRTPEPDSAEAERLRNWDPNAGLAGHVASRPDLGTPPAVAPTNPADGTAIRPIAGAPVVVVPLPGPRASAGAATAPATAVPAVPAAVSPPAAQRDPAAILSGREAAPAKPSAAASTPTLTTNARSQRDPAALLAGQPERSISGQRNAAVEPMAAEHPHPSSSGTGPVYYVQAGAYSSANEAEQQRARLVMQSFEGARVHVREVAGRTVYRVRIGPFDSRNDADRLKDKLQSSSTDAIVVPVQRLAP